MLTTLKDETKTFHNSVEKVLIKELKQLSSIEAYYRLLVKLLNFYEPVENRIQNIINEDVLKDIRERKHMQRLKLDLKEFNSSYQYPENSFVKKITSVSYALGVLYVIEGSTLGGQIISDMLISKLSLSEEQSVVNYFNSYDKQTPDMWQKFKFNIENSSYKINSSELTNGAKDTFSELEKWLLNY